MNGGGGAGKPSTVIKKSSRKMGSTSRELRKLPRGPLKS